MDDLSYRELQVLALLDQYSSSGTDPTHESQVAARREFKNAMTDRLGINPEEILAALARLQRSGLFAVATTGVTDDGAFGIPNTATLGFGELSPRYYRLKKLIGSLDLQQPA